MIMTQVVMIDRSILTSEHQCMPQSQRYTVSTLHKLYVAGRLAVQCQKALSKHKGLCVGVFAPLLVGVSSRLSALSSRF